MTRNSAEQKIESALIKMLKKNAIFSALDEKIVEKILSASETISLKAGEVIVKEGEPGDSLFFILSGSVRVYKTQGSERDILSYLSKGDVFGEICLLLTRNRAASVETLTNSKLIRISKKSLDPVMKSHPSLLLSLNKVMSERISLIEDDESQKSKFRYYNRPDFDPSVLDMLVELNLQIGGEAQVVHSRETAILAREMSKLLCPMIQEQLYYAGYMHEIGKIGIPLELIIKERIDPESLTQEEKSCFADMYSAGARTLSPDPNLYTCVNFVEYLSKDSFLEMPIEAQILKTADDFLMLSSAHYRNLGHKKALSLIRCFSGLRYNPKIVAVLEKAIHKFLNIQSEKQLEFINQMNIALNLKDEYTLRHSQHTMDTSVRIAHHINGKIIGGKKLEMTPDDIRILGYSSSLHDIGKIQIPTEILLAPRRLTVEEMDVMRRHAEFSSSFFRDIPGMSDLTAAVRHHHEKYDGSGYPDGLKGNEIPVMSRIMAIADVYSALTTERIYRRDDKGEKVGFPPLEALKIMSEMDGHFDPDIFGAFREIIEEEEERKG